MEDLLRLLPRWLVVAVVAPFLLGTVGLLVMVGPTPSGRAFVFLLAVGGVLLLVLLAGAAALLVVQSRGLEKVRDDSGN